MNAGKSFKTSEVRKTLDRLLDQSRDLAYAHIKERVHHIMSMHPSLTCFCMCMGSACFYKKNPHGPGDDPVYGLTYTKVLMNFINDYDRHFGLTGSPLRWDRVGDKLVFSTDW